MRPGWRDTKLMCSCERHLPVDWMATTTSWLKKLLTSEYQEKEKYVSTKTRVYVRMQTKTRVVRASTKLLELVSGSIAAHSHGPEFKSRPRNHYHY